MVGDNEMILHCDECNKVIKSYCWRIGDMVAVFCSKKHADYHSNVHRENIIDTVKDDKVVACQEDMHGKK